MLQLWNSSKKFLEQIKTYFNIKNKIYFEETKGEIDGRRFKGHKYLIYLGAKLFNEMLDNYSESMIKKRHYFTMNKERIKKIRENVWISSERKFQGTKLELTNLIRKIPMSRIGEIYGVSSNTIKKWCIKWGIETPSRGYWAKKYNCKMKC